MASEETEFKHESLQDCDTIVKYLNAIGEGFQSGHLTLANGDGREMEVRPSGLLKLDLKARRKDGRIKLSLKVTWKEQEMPDDIDSTPLTIEPKRD
ncbi:amphi-Trp domain-containing protein [candidate division GN15 bacterium]|nr:amphi-Trp domain-containing protein [candidate division GN15 bacterium]